MNNSKSNFSYFINKKMIKQYPFITKFNVKRKKKILKLLKNN